MIVFNPVLNLEVAIPLLYLVIFSIARAQLIGRAFRNGIRGELAQYGLGKSDIAAIDLPRVTWLANSDMRWIREYETAAVDAEKAFLEEAHNEGELPSRALTRARQLDESNMQLDDIADRLRILAIEEEPDATQLRGALLAAFRALRESETDALDNLMTEHRKAYWITVVGTLVIALLTWVTNTEEVMLLGVVGAITSRIFRTARGLMGAGTGSAWTALLAAAPAGALAAFGGTLLIHLARELELVGEVFVGVEPQSKSLTTLAIAFLLGFAERLLDSLAGSAEAAVVPPPTAPKDGGDDDGGQPAPAEGLIAAAAEEAREAAENLQDEAAANPTGTTTASPKMPTDEATDPDELDDV